MQRRPSKNVVVRLADEIENAGRQNLLPDRIAHEICEILKNRSASAQVELAVPKKIYCSSFTDNVRTHLVRCRACGAIADITNNRSIIARPRCPYCGGETVPAPVWVIMTDPQTQLVLTEDNRMPFILSIEDYAQMWRLGSVRRCYISDRSRPIAGLRIDTTQGSRQEIRPATRYGTFRYVLSMTPTEGMVRPISITAFAYEEERCESVSLMGEELDGVEDVLFCRELEVLQVTPAYRIGHPSFSSSYRVPVISYNRESEGACFSEALSVPQSEIAVFDNSPGGLGGAEGVLFTSGSALYLNPNFELFVRRAWDCPLACLRACKACLFTDSCYMLNWQLDRRVLMNLGWR